MTFPKPPCELKGCQNECQFDDPRRRLSLEQPDETELERSVVFMRVSTKTNRHTLTSTFAISTEGFLRCSRCHRFRRSSSLILWRMKLAITSSIRADMCFNPPRFSSTRKSSRNLRSLRRQYREENVGALALQNFALANQKVSGLASGHRCI